MIRKALFFICFLCSLTGVHAQLKTIKAGFAHPPDRYKPGVYWYFMDGNMSAESITKDLEAMKKAGIGNLVFLEVNVGIPRGPVEFLSDKWTALFLYAEKEARRLGIEITLGIGPGWTGSGGPWVKGGQSMQHLVASAVTVTAGDTDKIVLPLPLPKKPFFGEDGLTPEVKKEWLAFYKDVAVLAFPAAAQNTPIADYEEKALYYRAPYSSAVVRACLPAPAHTGSTAEAISKNSIIDLTGKMQPDGTLNWLPPAGKWTVMRFVSRNNGAITRPAPVPGLGLEADKFDTTAINYHLDKYLGPLFKRIGTAGRNNGAGGLKRLHMDSWEMGAQNWTPLFRNEFIKRRGYDPLKYYPVYTGAIVGSLEESERFLWDLRQTAQELVLENHARHVKAYAKRNHLTLSIEPYDMNPTADLELGAVADVPMGEFWSKGFGFNSAYSVIEATSVGHVNGRSLIPAEAFTAQGEDWKQHPASMKNQGDWAFAAGINRFVYHTFQNQFLADSLKPGATMGPYGVHWDRSQTWWPMVSAYHSYVTRCQYLLQQGRAVADVLYLTPEDAPMVFVPPVSAIAGDTIGDRKGYNFDGCPPGRLMTAMVKGHRVVFPGGAAYRLLVLPVYASMTPQLLAKIGELVKQGAMVVGNPPLRSPSLSGYPACDRQLAMLVKTIWGTADVPQGIVRHRYGQGTLVWGSKVGDNPDKLYPHYALTAGILEEEGISEDFTANGPLRYAHRSTADADIYFVSNTTAKPVAAIAQFRSAKGAPELWNAVSGKISRITAFEKKGGNTSVALQLDAYESAFVVFASGNSWPSKGLAEHTYADTLQTLTGPWKLSFDSRWGGPDSTIFNQLTDWSVNSDEGIKYYSGAAVYHKKFDLIAANAGKLYLNLGNVKNIARVTLNGKDLGIVWTAPWQVEISGVVQQKNNDLKIEVINLWPNRLIGDESKPYDGIADGKWPEWLLKKQPRSSGRYTFTTTRQYSAGSPLLPSGLMGPVTITQLKPK